MSDFCFPDIKLYNQLDVIANKRLAIDNLSKTILGSLSYLYDSHVHDSSDYSTDIVRFSLFHNGEKVTAHRILTNLRIFLGKYIVNERHLEGSWPSQIHYLPELIKNFTQPFFVVTDYNLFSTASTAYSLFLFDDINMPENIRPVREMLRNATNTISKFKKGDAYNFWIPHFNNKQSYIFSKPLNLPVSIVDLRYKIYKLTGLLGLKDFNGSDTIFNWLEKCYDKHKNPWGSSVIFNLPNDADNTSVAIATQVLYNKCYQNNGVNPDVNSLEKVSLFRDINRKKIDINNNPADKDTGAFLTWFKDEDVPVFSLPQHGIIPLEINNVDITINSNILFALALTNKKSTPGFQETINYIARAIDQKTWQEKSVYYPQKLIFAYSLSRARRDGDIDDPVLDQSLGKLMKQLLEEQAAFEKRYSYLQGAFPDDKSSFLLHSTGLGLVTLLNMGRSMAERHGLLEHYKQVIDNAVLFLIKNCNPIQALHKSTKDYFPDIQPIYWNSGLLYASSKEQLARWYSHAQTTSLILEGLTKYVLAYDIDESKFLSRRIYLNNTGNKLSLSLYPVK